MEKLDGRPISSASKSEGRLTLPELFHENGVAEDEVVRGVRFKLDPEMEDVVGVERLSSSFLELLREANAVILDDNSESDELPRENGGLMEEEGYVGMVGMVGMGELVLALERVEAEFSVDEKVGVGVEASLERSLAIVC